GIRKENNRANRINNHVFIASVDLTPGRSPVEEDRYRVQLGFGTNLSGENRPFERGGGGGVSAPILFLRWSKLLRRGARAALVSGPGCEANYRRATRKSTLD
ncbi:hypothetical protein GWI33_011189, partial [Rhynchophorus ferrugineus]